MADDRIAKIVIGSRPNKGMPPDKPAKRWYESWNSARREAYAKLKNRTMS